MMIKLTVYSSELSSYVKNLELIHCVCPEHTLSLIEQRDWAKDLIKNIENDTSILTNSPQLIRAIQLYAYEKGIEVEYGYFRKNETLKATNPKVFISDCAREMQNFNEISAVYIELEKNNAEPV